MRSNICAKTLRTVEADDSTTRQAGEIAAEGGVNAYLLNKSI